MIAGRYAWGIKNALSRVVHRFVQWDLVLFPTSDVKGVFTRGDQKVRGKVLLNRIAFIDCNGNS